MEPRCSLEIEPLTVFYIFIFISYPAIEKIADRWQTAVWLRNEINSDPVIEDWLKFPLWLFSYLLCFERQDSPVNASWELRSLINAVFYICAVKDHHKNTEWQQNNNKKGEKKKKPHKKAPP